MSKEIYEAGYDIYLSTIIGGGSESTCIATLKAMGVTDKQISQMKNSATKVGMAFPVVSVDKPRKTFRWDDRLNDLPDSSKFQNVADQFLLFIYGFKFNYGINGAFGTAQQIKVEARNYVITLVFPIQFQVHFENKCQYEYIRKLKSSISHYEREGKGTVILAYE